MQRIFRNRVDELKHLAVENFPCCASNVRSFSVAYEAAIIKSRARRQEEWVWQAGHAYVTTAPPMFLPRVVYSLIVLIEHAYSSLTMEAVLIFGVEIISEVYRLNCKSGATKEAFGRCMSATRADAASERCTLLINT